MHRKLAATQALTIWHRGL